MKGKYIDPEKKRTSIVRIILIASGLIIIGLFIFIIMHACSGKVDLYSTLVTATKDYYSSGQINYPEAIGQCNNITLKSLKDNNVIKNVKLFNNYDEEKSYVKVCKLESGDYQYTPIIQSEKDSTIFEDWQIGSEDDLIQGSSDVSFKFFGEKMETGSKKYYPSDNAKSDKVAEYYIDVPKEGYTYKDSPAIAYKWYVERQQKVYYKNGEYTSTQPSGFTNSESGKSNSYISLKQPESSTNRISNKTTVFASEVVAKPYKYVCKSNANNEGNVISSTICEKRTNTDTFKVTSSLIYTCDGTHDVASNTICSARTNWTTSSCKSNSQTKTGKTSDGYDYSQDLITGKRCISTIGYTVTDKLWKWYKLENVKLYYPSDNADVNKENTYYENTPTAGAVKDESTKSTAYKYYQLYNDGVNMETNWVSIGEDFINEDEIINKFKELGYNVNSLSDIEKNDNIRYQIQMSYRKRK